MKKSNAFKYIFIIVTLILATITFLIYDKDKKTTESKSATQEIEETGSVVRELRLAISGLDTINPIISRNKYIQEISKIIFDPLVTIDENYAKSYALASEISKTDDITYIIKLKEDIKWSDGTEFKADIL